MGDAVELKVCIRCRPFSHKDKLGVLISTRKDAGEMKLVNLEQEREMSVGRYAFNNTWWSAPNFEKFLTNDDRHLEECKTLKVITQEDVYGMVGEKILNNLLNGQSVVLFAYGLSGAGKTYTVFGADDPKSSIAWYKFSKPHEHWGLFPRLAYKLLQMAAGSEGWKVRLKYYQNVVDTVMDLLSPNAAAKHYHHGMHKDAHGFMDMSWCKTVEIESWDELIATLTTANKKKSIAPTQFNPSSTRGHCILFFEVDMPDPNNHNKVTVARMYVCDLAGAEPASDVYWANYGTKTVNGHVEYISKGRDPDKQKTKMLVEQGKTINLSLSEMALFFKKMASQMKRHKNKLKPGETVVGCNNYFLGKFLKHTLLQAHTYLFAAVRPELLFQTYTRSTLDFAKHASLVRLLPKQMNKVRRDSTFHVQTPNLGHREEVGTLKRKVNEMQEAMQGNTAIVEHDRDFCRRLISNGLRFTGEQKTFATNALNAAVNFKDLHRIIIDFLAGSHEKGSVPSPNDNVLKQWLMEMYSAYVVATNNWNLEVEEKSQSVEKLEKDVYDLSKLSSKQLVTINHLKRDNEQYKKHAEETIEHIKREGKSEGKGFAERISKLQSSIESSNAMNEKMHLDLEKAHQHESKALLDCIKKFNAEKSKLKLQIEGLLREKKKLERTVQSKETELEEFREQKDLAHEEIHLLQSRVQQEHKKRAKDLMRRISVTAVDKTHLLKTKKDNAEKLKEHDEKSEKKLMALQASVKSLTHTNETIKSNLKQARGALLDSQRECNEKRQQYKLLETKLLGERDSHNANKDIMIEKVKHLELSLQKFQDKCNVKDSETKIIQEKLTELLNRTELDNARRDSELEICARKANENMITFKQMEAEKQKDLEAASLMRISLEKENSSLQNLLSASQRDSARLHQINQEVQENLDSFKKLSNKDNDNLKAEIIQLKAKLKTNTAKSRQELSKCSESNAKVSVQLQSQKSRFDNLKIVVAKLKEDSAERIESLTKEKESEETALRETLRGQHNDISLLKAELSDRKRALKETRAELQELRKDHYEIIDMADALKEEKHSLSQEIMDQTNKIQNLNVLLDKKDELISAVNRKHKTTLKDKQSEMQGLKRNQEDIIMKEKQVRTNLGNTCTTLKSNLKTANDNVKKLRTQNAELMEKLHEIDTLRASMLSKDTIIDTLRTSENAITNDRKRIENMFQNKCEELLNKSGELDDAKRLLRKELVSSKLQQKAIYSHEIQHWKERSLGAEEQLIEYKTLLAEARLKNNIFQDEQTRLRSALVNAKEEALMESKTEVNSELVTLRMTAKTAVEKFKSLQEQYEDTISDNKNNAERYSAQIAREKRSLKEQVEMLTSSLRNAIKEKDIVQDHLIEVKSRLAKSSQSNASISDILNRRDVKILSLEKLREEDNSTNEKLRQSLLSMSNRTAVMEKEIEDAKFLLKIKSSDLERVEQLNMEYVDRQKNHQEMISKCQESMSRLFQVGTTETYLLRLNESPTQKQFRGRPKKKYATNSRVAKTARHVRNSLLMKEIGSRNDGQFFFTPDKNSNSRHDFGMRSKPSPSYRESNLELGDLMETSTRRNAHHHLDSSSGVDESLSSLVSSFNVLSKQLKLRGSEL